MSFVGWAATCVAKGFLCCVWSLVLKLSNNKIRTFTLHTHTHIPLDYAGWLPQFLLLSRALSVLLYPCHFSKNTSVCPSVNSHCHTHSVCMTGWLTRCLPSSLSPVILSCCNRSPVCPYFSPFWCECECECVCVLFSYLMRSFLLVFLFSFYLFLLLCLMTNPSKSRTRTMCGEADGLAANGWLIMDRLMCVCVWAAGRKLPVGRT